MARRVALRPISDYKGNRLLRIVRRSSGSVVTWRRDKLYGHVKARKRRGELLAFLRYLLSL